MVLAQVVYERGLILQITLLAPELRSKGLRFESKGRGLDGHDDFPPMGSYIYIYRMI